MREVNLVYILDIGTRIPFLRYLSTSTNSDVILIAYRGYSDSQGYPTQTGIKKDSEAIIKYANQYKTERKPELNIYVLGRSLGGAVALHVCNHPNYKHIIKALILENTFTSIGDMIDAVMPLVKYFKFLQTNHWQSISIIKNIQIPILFVKSQRDQLVPPKQMQQLKQNAKKSKYIQEYKIPYGTHNSSWDQNPDQYFSTLLGFFNNLEGI